jgi:hypothetical protein
MWLARRMIVMLHGKIKLKGVGLVKMEDRWWYGIAGLWEWKATNIYERGKE